MKDRTLKIMLLSVWLFNSIDYVSTKIAIANGVPEGNAAIDAIIGTMWFPIVKLVLVPLGLYLIWIVRGKIRRPVLLAVGVPFVAYSLLTGWHIWGQFFM